MSLREEFGNGYENLNTILEPYLEALEGKEVHLKLQGKLLERANMEQASWLSFYDERKIELSTYLKFFEMEIARVRAVCLRNMEQYPKDLSDRTKEKYIDQNEQYLQVYEKYLAVRELYMEYESIVQAFIQRGYQLRNITNLRVAALEDVIL